MLVKKESRLPRTHPPQYPPEYRQQIIELVPASRQTHPSVLMVDQGRQP